jgi:hypothetical protein
MLAIIAAILFAVGTVLAVVGGPHPRVATLGGPTVPGPALPLARYVGVARPPAVVL